MFPKYRMVNRFDSRTRTIISCVQQFTVIIIQYFLEIHS